MVKLRERLSQICGSTVKGSGEKLETTLSVFKNQFNLEHWTLRRFYQIYTVVACITSENLFQEISSLGQHVLRQESTKKKATGQEGNTKLHTQTYLRIVNIIGFWGKYSSWKRYFL